MREFHRFCVVGRFPLPFFVFGCVVVMRVTVSISPLFSGIDVPFFLYV